MLARLDNFGPFHFFFTLSCADLRWNENLAAILSEKGWTVIYKLEEDKDGHPCNSIYVEYEKYDKHHRKEIREFMKDEIDDSLHECIRGNVLLATRFFNQRVKQFINEIVMGGGNPMNVDKYSYKVEFQDRGAGHVHGTLWVNLHVIERMRRLDDGSLISEIKYKKDGRKEEYTTPFIGLQKAFQKFRNAGELDDDEEKAVIEFIDQFTTVSLNEDEVGADVVK